MIFANIFLAVALCGLVAVVIYAWRTLRHFQTVKESKARIALIKGTHCDVDGPCEICELELFEGGLL